MCPKSGFDAGNGPETGRKPPGGIREETGNLVQNKSVIRFQGLLGFAVLAAVGLLAWCYLNGLVFEERPVRAKAEAQELARVTLDYHADTGQWPRNPDLEIDLTLLLGHRSGRKATNLAAGAPVGGFGGLADAEAPPGHLGAGKSWLAEIPLDPWGCPYRVMVTDAAIAVLSIGPNRKLDTDPAKLWTRPGNINPCDGDDVGIVLEIDQDGAY